MLITMLLLLILFIASAFIIVWVILDNKKLKDRFGNNELQLRRIEDKRKRHADEALKFEKKKISVLADDIKQIKSANRKYQKVVSDLTEENRRQEELIKNLKSVSISERAFLIDLEE